LKQKLEEADDSPEHSEIMPSSPSTQVLMHRTTWRNLKE